MEFKEFYDDHERVLDSKEFKGLNESDIFFGESIVLGESNGKETKGRVYTAFNGVCGTIMETALPPSVEKDIKSRSAEMEPVEDELEDEEKADGEEDEVVEEADDELETSDDYTGDDPEIADIYKKTDEPIKKAKEKDIEDIKKHYNTGKKFEIGNIKISDKVAVFNMTLATTCPSDNRRMCFASESCYAKKTEAMYPDSKMYRKRQMSYWAKCSAKEFVEDLLTAIEKSGSKGKKIQYLRFNESGDFRNQGDVSKASEIASALKGKGITTYTYTARKDLNFGGASFICRGSGYPDLCKNGYTVIYDSEEYPKGIESEGDFTACPMKGCGESCLFCMSEKVYNITFPNHGGNVVVDKMVSERYKHLYAGGDYEPLHYGYVNGEGNYFVIPVQDDSGRFMFTKKNNQIKFGLLYGRKESAEEELENVKELIIKSGGISKKDFTNALDTLRVYDFEEYGAEKRAETKQKIVKGMIDPDEIRKQYVKAKSKGRARALSAFYKKIAGEMFPEKSPKQLSALVDKVKMWAFKSKIPFSDRKKIEARLKKG